MEALRAMAEAGRFSEINLESIDTASPSSPDGGPAATAGVGP